MVAVNDGLGLTIMARLQQRALVVLLAAEGRQNKDIAIEVGLDRRQVALWRKRFLAGGIDALRKDAPRSGRPATITAETESRIVQATLHDKPVNATHWSTRTLAEHLGLGSTTVRRVWQSNGLKGVGRGVRCGAPDGLMPLSRPGVGYALSGRI